MVGRLRALLPQSQESEIRSMTNSCFPHEWLIALDEAELPDENTPECAVPVPAGGYRRFDNNYARFAALDIHMRRSKTGFLLQAVAGGFHVKTPGQLKQLADRVGRERIMVLHGTVDRMISADHGKKLIKYLKPSKALIVEGLGGAPRRCSLAAQERHPLGSAQLFASPQSLTPPCKLGSGCHQA
ncbi:hypothetical protein Hte_000731 [Hypoxylon texense]